MPAFVLRWSVAPSASMPSSILFCAGIERRPPRLDMTVYPYLPRAHVAATSPAAYMSLLSGARS